ncbi:PTS glucose transporter subunit IIA [Enterococcus asini]|uniref:PTS sugar transporter subunit IIA n=1 Tax=Enterococcus asini TaxID=57732 RepID=UPI0032E40F24
MFGIFKKKKTEIFSPVAGEVIKIEEVADPVFNQKMMGEGFAVKPINGEITAPVSGVIQSIFPTKHALIIETENKVGLLIHVGIDTVDLEGKGFESFVEAGQKVAAKERLLQVDLDVLKANEKDDVVMVVFPEEKDLQLNVQVGTGDKNTVAAVIE